LILIMRIAIILLLMLILPTACPAAGGRVDPRDYAVLKKAYEQLQTEAFEACLNTLSPLLDKASPISYALSYAALASGGLNRPDQAAGFLTLGTRLYPEKINFWHNLGIYQMQDGDFSGAARTFEKLIAMEKQTIPESYYYHLSFALYRLEQYDSALNNIRKITTGLQVEKQVKKHHLQLKAHCLIALKRWKDCQLTVQRLIRLDPVDPRNWDILGQITLNLKDYDLACAALEIKNILDETGVRDRTLEQLYRMQSAWNEAARLQCREDNYMCAQSLFRAGQYEKAIAVLARDPARHMEKSYFRGRLLFALGNNEKAVESLLEVEDLEYQNQVDQNRLGLKETRRLKDALLARSLLLAGQICRLDRNWVEARNIFKKLELLPGQENMGRGLAACMQFYLDETGAGQDLPGLYDPPMVMSRPDF